MHQPCYPDPPWSWCWPCYRSPKPSHWPPSASSLWWCLSLSSLIRHLTSFAQSICFQCLGSPHDLLLDMISWKDLNDMTFRSGLCPFVCFWPFISMDVQLALITSTKVTIGIVCLLCFPSRVFSTSVLGISFLFLRNIFSGDLFTIPVILH